MSGPIGALNAGSCGGASPTSSEKAWSLGGAAWSFGGGKMISSVQLTDA
jgi:hypothetical protein